MMVKIYEIEQITRATPGSSLVSNKHAYHILNKCQNLSHFCQLLGQYRPGKGAKNLDSHEKLIIYRFLAQNIGIQSGPNASIFLHVGHHNTYRCGTTHWFSWDMLPIQYMPISKISGSKFIQIVACSVRKEPLMCEGKNKRQWMGQSFFTHSSEHVIQIRNQDLVISNLPYLQRKRALLVGNKY